MPDSPLAVAGAEVQPTAAAPLHTNEFFTGLWTQGNPLGPGAVPFLYQKFYSAARFDRLVGGQNTEVTTRLTLGRRPGSSVYNSNAFPPINRFYEFRAFQTAGEVIHTLASCDAATGSTQGTVRDVTGPTNNVVLWKKDPAAGRTSFQNVGNLLYFADGVDEKKWVTSARSWVTNSPVVGNIASIQVKAEPTRSPGVYVYVLVVNLSAPLSVLPAAGQVMTLAGLTAYTALNGTSWTFQETAGYYGQDVSNTSQLFFDAQALSTYATTADTGTITTGANPASLFAAGDWIVDTNNNIQKAMGAQVANIIGVQVQTTFIPGAIILPGRAARLVNLFFDPATPLNLDDGIQLNLAGLTTRAGLNGVTGYSVQVQSSTHITFAAVYVAAAVPVTAFVAETGTASTGTGLTGGSQPAWDASAPVTQDGGQQWSNMGSAVQNWGFPAPAVAPSVTQAAAPSIYPAWAANTWYSPSFVILDTNGNLQRLTTAGVTAGGAPAWNITVGGTTADNTAVWTNLGPSGWVGATVYAVGAAVQATYSYYITVPVIMYHWNGYTLVPTITYQQQLVTVTSLFVCAQAGTSGTNVPSWTNGTGTTVIDGTVGWKNVGAAPAWPGAAQTLSLAAKIIDSNSNIQTPLSTGISSGAAPAWKTANGATTPDTGLSWLNGGPYSAANTGAWRWAYSGKNSITGHVGTASPMSIELVTAAGQLPVVQGQGLSDIQIDTIVLWRTEQGGSTLLYNDEFGNPGAGQTWIYTDTTQDASSSSSASQGQLNPLITAPINSVNDPPPAGFIPQCYYLNRIWGYKGNRLIWSTGPDAVTGSGDESFSPGNGFNFPSAGVTCWPTSIGLMAYTNSDVWAVLGKGTTSSPFYVVNFQAGVGLAGQDALCVNGSTGYGMLTSGQVVSMDPGAGELEVGFPIGDQFNALYTPGNTYCVWHQGSSADMGLYVADGATGWFRMGALAAPEQGNVWSPRAQIVGGVRAIASVEITPGVKKLLLGPAAQGQPILMRDASVSNDGGTPYPADANVGSIVIAQPGGTAGLQFITTEETAIAGSSRCSVAVMLDEITGDFTNLVHTSNDPPNLAPSKSVTATRFWATQGADNVQKCRHLQVKVSWNAESYPNELLTYTIYGRLPEKARK